MKRQAGGGWMTDAEHRAYWLAIYVIRIWQASVYARPTWGGVFPEWFMAVGG